MIKFRSLKKEDLADVLKLAKQLTKNLINFDIDSVLDDSGCNCLVLEDDTKIIGFGALVVFRAPFKGLVGNIEDIVVDDDYRGQGLGRKLMQELIGLAKSKHLVHLDLTSNPSRVPARKLYESLGFELRNTGVFRLKLKKNL